MAMFLLAAAAFPQAYDEDPLKSMPIRIEQWKQMQAYIAALPAPARPRAGAAFRDRIGYPPPGFLKNPTLRLEKIGEDATATWHRCWIRVTPEMETYGLYLVPKSAKKPAPLVISQHGGGGYPELAAFQGGSNYHDMVRGAAAEGYVVFAPLVVMYPYRDRDHGTPIPENVRGQFDDTLRDKGTSLAAVEVYKISKALDVLLRRPEIDRRRVAMVGLSDGGYYTLYATALEPRIRVAVASCAFRDQAASTGKTAGRLTDLSSDELVALIRPRPLQVQSGIHDKGFPIDNVRQAVAKAEKHYSAPSLKGRFVFEAFDGGHEFRGDLAWKFLREQLRSGK